MIKTNVALSILRYALFDKIELKDGYILRTWKWFGFIEGATDAFKAERAVFCDEGSGIFGKSLFFGAIDKSVEDKRIEIKVAGKTCWNESGMDIYGLKKDDVEKIKQYLISCGAKLSDDEAIEYKSKFPLLNPFRWFMPRESLRFGKEGIFHTRKTVRKTRTSYIPYEDLKVFSGFGLFRKKLTLFGDVSVITKERFSNETFKKVKELVDKRAKVLSAVGKLYRPALLSFKRRNKYVLLLNEGFIAKDKSKIYYFGYNDIENYGFERKRWCSLFGKFWCIAYRDDARDYSFTKLWFSDSVHEFEVPGILTWKWRYLLFFRGSLKKRLKESCKRAKKQMKQIRREAHKQDRDMYIQEIKEDLKEL